MKKYVVNSRPWKVLLNIINLKKDTLPSSMTLLERLHKSFMTNNGKRLYFFLKVITEHRLAFPRKIGINRAI